MHRQWAYWSHLRRQKRSPSPPARPSATERKPKAHSPTSVSYTHLDVYKRQQLEFGIHSTANTIDYQYIQNDTVNVLSKSDRGLITAFYLQDQMRLFNTKLLLKPGLRINHFNVTNKLYFEPRLSATYALTDKIKLKMATGRYFQFAKQINREDLTQGNRSYGLLANGGTLPVSYTHLDVYKRQTFPPSLSAF